jgi:glycosyltransferase involved in cell wall biosynthesis
MKIVMISGSWPPARCGVGDYTSILCKHLSAEGADVIPLKRENWSLSAAFEYKNTLRKIDPDAIHIQYPTVGYGRSLLPALTCYLVPELPVVVTLHEFQIFKRYRWPWFYSYSQNARARIFSRAAEAEAFAKRFPARKGEEQIVPIGSNIPTIAPAGKKAGNLIFFGLFWPGKGIEEFLELAELLMAEEHAIRPIVLGSPVPGQEAFSDHIRNECPRLGIDLHENLPADQVALKLAESEFAYLPFPDGADERRGTLAAAITNSCIVLTPHKEQTPDWLRRATLCANSPEEAYALLKENQSDSDVKHTISGKLKEAARKYDWTAIAQLHIGIYNEAIGN